MYDLFIGDLHCKADNLKDTENIFNLILGCINDNKINNIIFLGDVFHNHNSIDLTVANFVKKQFARLFNFKDRVFVLAGNHDGYSPKSVEINAIDVILDQYAITISKPLITDNYVFLPYIGNGCEFIDLTKRYYDENKILVCHQSFIGGVYENGHPINDGVYPTDIPFKFVINGHIHKAQKISNVVCLGTPRAITTSEANQEKGLFLFNGTDFKIIPTKNIVKQYKKYELYEPNDINSLNVEYNEGDDIRIHIIGSKEYYNTQSKYAKSYFKLVPHIKKDETKQTISLEKEESLMKALLKYVKEVADIPHELKDKIWNNLINMIQK